MLIVILLLTGLGTAAQPHAMDSQGEDPPEDDLQPPTSQLSEVPVQILHRSGSGAPLAGLPWTGDVQHAGGGQQGQGWRSLPSVWTGEFLYPMIESLINH